MPEEAPAVQNWRLLIVACVLGLVVMVVYNIHIGKVRRGLDVAMVPAFRYTRNLEVGDKLAEDDLERIEIPKKTAESIGRLLEENEKDTMAIDRTINRDVSKSDFAMTGHFTTASGNDPAASIGKGSVQVTIPVDSKRVPGRVLRIGNHVNILGMLPSKSGSDYTTYRIIEWLKVVAIGGQTDRGGSMQNAEAGVRNYKSITVEMKRKDPDVSLQWSNLQTHLRGPAIIEICPSRYVPQKGSAGVINPDLVRYTTKAAIVSDGGFDDGSY